MSLSLKNIKGDIATSKFCLSPVVNWFNDEALYSIAAYHAEQATEKCLKLVLSQCYGIPESNKRYRTHDIPDLLAYIEECRTDTGKDYSITIPEIIEELSIEIKGWEANTRYNDNMVLLRNNVMDVIRACENMYRNLKQNGYN